MDISETGQHENVQAAENQDAAGLYEPDNEQQGPSESLTEEHQYVNTAINDKARHYDNIDITDKTVNLYEGLDMVTDSHQYAELTSN